MDKTARDSLVPIGVLLLVVLGVSTLMGGMMHGWMWGFGMGLGGLMMLAFWGVLIVAGVALFRASGGSRGGRPQSTPSDILKRRYAAGDITRDQYEQMRKDLE